MVTNVGDGVASGVVLTDPLPVGLTLRSAVAQVGDTTFTNPAVEHRHAGSADDAVITVLATPITITPLASTGSNTGMLVGVVTIPRSAGAGLVLFARRRNKLFT